MSTQVRKEGNVGGRGKTQFFLGRQIQWPMHLSHWTEAGLSMCIGSGRIQVYMLCPMLTTVRSLCCQEAAWMVCYESCLASHYPVLAPLLSRCYVARGMEVAAIFPDKGHDDSTLSTSHHKKGVTTIFVFSGILQELLQKLLKVWWGPLASSPENLTVTSEIILSLRRKLCHWFGLYSISVYMWE